MQAGLGLLPALLVLLDSAESHPMDEDLSLGPHGGVMALERLNVRGLPSLGPLHHVELHGLTFLQALETT
jgi:hypothetical protein